MWVILLFLLPFTIQADDLCPYEVLGGQKILEDFKLPEKVDPFTFRKQKIAWTKSATQAIAAANDLSPQQKADAFEQLANEISRRAKLTVDAYHKEHPDKPLLAWSATRKETPFGTAFEGEGGHVLLIDGKGQLWEIRRYTSDRIDDSWNPGWDAKKRPAFQDAPVLVVPPADASATRRSG